MSLTSKQHPGQPGEEMEKRDMKIENYGYQEETLKIRTMSMAELRIGIIQTLIKKNYRQVTIKLVNTTCGEVDTYQSTEDFLMADYNEAFEVEFISMKEVLYYEESENASKTRIVILIRDILD